MAQALNPTPDEIAAAELPSHPTIPAQLKPVHDELSELRRMVSQLCKLVAPLSEPAQPTMFTLDSTTPRKTSRERGMVTASLGVFNPSAVTILIGIGGGAATSQARALAVPRESLLVLPVACGDVEVATEAELGGGTAVVHVLRYRTVQPAFLGSAR
jgi:hypothetical protein